MLRGATSTPAIPPPGLNDDPNHIWSGATRRTVRSPMTALIPRRLWLIAGGDPPHSLGDPDDCNVYAVRSSAGLVLVDSGVGRDPGLLRASLQAEGLDPTEVMAVILTHTHLDHSGGAAWLHAELGATIYGSSEAVRRLAEGDEAAISLPAAKRAGMYRDDDHLQPVVATIVSDGETLAWGDASFEILATPGHASDHLAYVLHVDGMHVLFSGDLLFPSGRVHLLSTPDSSLQALIVSLNRLRGVPVDALLAGHYAPVVDAVRARECLDRAHARLDLLEIPEVVE